MKFVTGYQSADCMEHRGEERLKEKARITAFLPSLAVLTMFTALVTGCSHSHHNNPTSDTTQPVVGGTLSTSSIAPFSLVVAWSAASDDVSDSSALSYKVVRASASADIDTVEEADAVTGEGLVMDWTAGAASAVAESLLSGTTYYFSVLVKDEAGNMTLYEPVSQKTAAADYPRITNLSNGNLLLVYRDADDGGIGKSVVYDETGQYVAGPTTVVPDGIGVGYATTLGLITHDTGVPVMSYTLATGTTGYFAVLDNDGEVAVGPVQYLNEVAIFTGALAGGSGNSLFIGSGRANYPSSGEQGAGYAVYNVNDGSSVKAVTPFLDGGGHNEIRGMAASAIGTDRFFLLYSRDWSELTPRFVIYDETGTVQVTDSAFATTKSNTYEIRKLADNNAFVAYIDLNDTNKGKLAVYQPTGDLAVPATTFADTALNNDYLAMTLTGAGDAFMAYSDSSDSNKAKYVIYDSAGTLVADATDVSSEAAYPYDAATLSNDSIALVSHISGNIYKLEYLTGL